MVAQKPIVNDTQKIKNFAQEKEKILRKKLLWVTNTSCFSFLFSINYRLSKMSTVFEFGSGKSEILKNKVKNFLNIHTHILRGGDCIHYFYSNKVDQKYLG